MEHPLYLLTDITFYGDKEQLRDLHVKLNKYNRIDVVSSTLYEAFKIKRKERNKIIVLDIGKIKKDEMGYFFNIHQDYDDDDTELTLFRKITKLPHYDKIDIAFKTQPDDKKPVIIRDKTNRFYKSVYALEFIFDECEAFEYFKNFPKEYNNVTTIETINFEQFQACFHLITGVKVLSLKEAIKYLDTIDFKGYDCINVGKYHRI